MIPGLDAANYMLAWILIFMVAAGLVGIAAALWLLVRSRRSHREAVAELVRLRENLDLSRLQAGLSALEKSLERVERAVREEVSRNREETAQASGHLREELAQASGKLREENAQASAHLRSEVGASLKTLGDTVVAGMNGISTSQKGQLESFGQRLGQLTDSNTKGLETLRAVLDERLKQMQADNAAKLEQMRATVDEKLQGTLEKRLGDSFKLVSERLEQVHKGLGEMQGLATGVGDLKRVLTNVKTRGTWGEFQLANLLEQILTPQQYEANVITKEGSREVVEFAVKLPGRDDVDGEPVWLPIDAKFPQEDYQRLLEAQEQADPEAAEAAAKALEMRVRGEAKDIRDKYLNPPKTTDFGILFLPTEGLYAEVLRRPGLAEQLQREYRVLVTGPTTLAALLNSLSVGFRTLAIGKRSAEVWNLLGAVKTEFGKFAESLDQVHKKLQEATNKIEGAATRTRQIERKLRGVQELPVSEAQALLPGGDGLDAEE